MIGAANRDPAQFEIRTGSTSRAIPIAMYRSVMACTIASAPRWRGSSYVSQLAAF